MRSGLSKPKGQLAIVSAFLVALMAQGCWRSRRPEVVLIPAGYVGWVKISYGLKQSPELAVDGGSYLIPISRDGHAYTSTPMASGLAGDRYFYVSERGQRLPLRLDDSSSGPATIQGTRYFTIPELHNQRPQQFRVFFVGSAVAYTKAQKDDEYLTSF